MKAAIERYLRYLSDELGSARNTLLAYRTDIEQFQRVVTQSAGAALAPDELRSEHVHSYSDWLSQRGYRASTISRKMAAVRSFLRYLIEHGETPDFPFLAGLKAPYSPRPKPRVLTFEEITRLLQAPSAHGSPRGLRDAAILQLLYATGILASQAVKLDVADLDERVQLLRIDQGDQVWLPLGSAGTSMARYLANGRPYLVRGRDDGALFLNLRGKRLSRQGLWLVVKKWSKAVNLDSGISPHSLRHSMIHHALKQGVSKRELQRMLGLSSPNAIRIKGSS